ncbi:hypothetical protein FJK98_15015 [Micromonospora sp. HM134]|uniref:hypothetical protein n=1 Tax=Micromonospora sp. HM134 TaxID=2583243 RepID=UPI001198A6C0|nr:hypothetical protein [Micromonospora sp. HM134]QDY08303.1 hypothetical protein FJK98_15015 [Micromonospora sp. HM134]
MAPTGRPVYGLCVHGLDEVEELAPAGSRPGWPSVRIRQTTAAPPPSAPLDLDGGVRVLADGRTLTVDRRRGTATFYGPPLAPDLLAHPYLAPVATVFNRWAGRETFHSGAFVHAGRAWAVVGPRTAGKSSLLAALAARDVPVVADDILVVDHTEVHAGPRCVDLREPVPGPALPTRTVRAGDRLRVALPPIAERTPLGGWLFLGWGPTPAVTPVPPAELLARLAGCRSWRGLPTDPAALLGLAALPAWDLTRPRDWAAFGPTLRLVERTLTAARAVAASR